MVFSSLVFMFAYLPLTLLIYYIVPRKGRNIFLFFINLLFYGWGEPKLIVLMLINIAVNYIGGYLVDKFKDDPKKRKLVLILTCVIDIGTLAVFKYTGMIVETVNMLPFLNLPTPQISLPIGISFYTFQTMSYVIDVYRGDAPVSKNPINFGTYVALFPQLIAGPIVRYRDVAEQLTNRKETLDEFTKGVNLFIIGLGKKVLIANQMGNLSTAMFATTDENGIVGTWVGIIAYSFQLYFDFSGYSDMACGLGNMLGFEFLKNFNYPYISKSVTEFWRRWHISLSTWFKEYVYIPLGGNRKGFGRQILNISIVWLLTGLWHGAYGNFVVWGIYYGILLMIEKLLWKPVFSRLPSFFMHLYTMFFVILGWGIFSWQDMADGTNYFKTLFGISGNFVNREAMYLLSSYLILLVIAIIGSVSLLRTCINRFFLPEKTMRREVCGTLFVVVVFILSVALLVNSSYNPFLYFRF